MLRTAIPSLLFASLIGAPAVASEAESPHFVVLGVDSEVPFPLLETRVKAQVSGVIAHVRITQVYVNEGAQPIEALYVFPASTRAAVFGLQMRIGARTITAKISEREAARRLYETAKSNGKSASLLEQHRPNVFQMNVANILPGDRVEVALDYTELLVPEDGAYELVVPAVVGPRYARGGASEDWTQNPYYAGREPPRFLMSAHLSAGLPIAAVTSPSHTISPRFTDANTADVEVDPAGAGGRDVVIRYRLGGDAIETGALLFEDATAKYFLLMVQPPTRPVANAIPPREYVFVVDVSGSMSGFPLQVAKDLMQAMLQNLRPVDRFNVLFFAGGSNVLADRSLVATPPNVARALGMLERQRGGGSTELLPALERALSLPRDEGTSTSIVVVTDGYVTVEKEAFERVRKSLGRANLFAFGIGTSVNRFLIEGLARAGMGEPFVITDRSAAPREAERFRKYIESPLLTNVRVEFEGFDAYDVEPLSVPDLFARRPLVIFGKYRGRPTGRAVVRGSNALGTHELELKLSRVAASDDHTALRHLWARHRIARLADAGQLAPDEATKAEVTKLGLEHGLLTDFTSFVAVDSIARSQGEPKKVVQPLPLPDGVSERAVGASASISYPMTFMPSGGDLGSRGSGVGGGGSGKSGVGGLSGMSMNSAVVSGSLDRGVIERVMKRAMSSVRAAYERGLKSDPNLNGRVVVKLEIDAQGRVEKATITSSTLGDAVVEKAILAALKKLRFPKPAGGGRIVVSYPFVFSPR